MIISITTGALSNSRPSKIGSLSINLDYSQIHTFTLANFTTETSPQYADPENDELSFVYIISLPEHGDLYLDGGSVSIGDEIPSGAISTGNFTYVPDDTITDASSFSFKFDIADKGSSTVSGLETGLVTFNIAQKPFEAPSVVGDNSISKEYGETIIFTAENFTTETTPVYVGASPYALKILSLPSGGSLQLNGVSVSINQEILITEISAGYFSFLPEPSVTTAVSYSFDFAVSDVLSKKFTE